MFISLNKGITDPLEFITFPYLTIEKIVLFPESVLLFTKSLSEASLVAPYKFIGLQALSVDRAITLFTCLSIAAFITFSAP